MVAFLVCHGISARIIAPLHPGRAAEAWAGQSGERFAQLAVFFPESAGFNGKSVAETRDSIESALLAVSLEADGEHRLYADAWAAEGKVSVTGRRGSAPAATVIGTGGDYFLFHPLYLRNGSYISQNDIMRNRVVLDEDLAWRLFGSVQLAGLDVIINNKPFEIAGVVARESSFAYDRALSADKSYEGGAGLFMSFEALDAMVKDMKAADGDSGGAWIGSYEIVMPDVVTDYARNSLIEALGDDREYQLVDNTNRFSYINLLHLIGSFGGRSMHTDAIALPYWENALRYAEDWLALLLGLSIVFMACPTVFAVIYSIKLIRFGFRKCTEIIRALLDKREDRKYAIYMKTRGRHEAL